MIEAPCLDCVDRHVGCHSTCDKYIQFKKDLNAMKQCADVIRRKERTYAAYKVPKIYKMRRRAGMK